MRTPRATSKRDGITPHSGPWKYIGAGRDPDLGETWWFFEGKAVLVECVLDGVIQAGWVDADTVLESCAGGRWEPLRCVVMDEMMQPFGLIDAPKARKGA